MSLQFEWDNKKTQISEAHDTVENNMFPEYDFDYSKARPNRFANRFDEKDQLVVLLDPDIAEIFTTTETVNTVLRALISTMPGISKTETGNESLATA
ncbi:MAG: hypothetical protein U9Q82_14135 [Chloroflexota bacterium]|nr:hypothetical protein [Chloroflexota bacterium]